MVVEAGSGDGGDMPVAKGSVCLFCSYFPGRSLPFFVRYYLEQLRPHFDRIVFLANDDRQLDDESSAWLAAHVEDVWLVRNEGYDFGMWQKAIGRLGGLSGYSRVALVNDSCVCFAPLDDLFRWLDAGGFPAAGVVLARGPTLHLQSFFLVFSAGAIPVVERHITSMPVGEAGFHEIIRRGELGLSSALTAAGIPLAARYCPEPDMTGNPSYLYCDRFIDEGMPLIKRKMLRYPEGALVEFAVRHGLGTHPSYYLRKIRARHAGRRAEIDRLFAGQQVVTWAGEFQLLRRVLRYRGLSLVARIRAWLDGLRTR